MYLHQPRLVKPIELTKGGELLQTDG